MVGINIQHGATVEHLSVNDVEIGTIGAEKLVFSGLRVGTVEEDLHFNVVEHTQRIIDRVVADGVDAHLANANATHVAVNIDIGSGSGGETTGLVCCSVVDEWHILGIEVLTQRRLTRHQGVDAVVFKAVVGNAEARHFDARTGTDRNGNQFIDDRNLRLALVAADDGVRKADP